MCKIPILNTFLSFSVIIYRKPQLNGWVTTHYFSLFLLNVIIAFLIALNVEITNEQDY